MAALFFFVLLCLQAPGPVLHAQNKSDDPVFQSSATLGEKAAAENLRRSAEAGSAKAQSELGKAYMEGSIFKQNTSEAVKWVGAAANQGLAEAEVNLATLYLEGRGVPQDYSKGFSWMKKAADQGDPKAEYNVGLLYGLGRGVRQDYQEGIRWYLKAAEAGDPAAAYNIGLAYSSGFGVARDEVKGYMWYYISAMRFGYPPSHKALDDLNTKLDPAKIAEGRKQAEQWIKAHPNVKAVPM
jgi:hypothetical protein